VKAILLPTLRGTSFLGLKSWLKSIFKGRKVNKKSIFDPTFNLNSKKSILSIIFWTEIDLIRTCSVVLKCEEATQNKSRKTISDKPMYLFRKISFGVILI